MINKVKQIIDKYDMLHNVDGIIIGLSGGPDSVCLLHILTRVIKNKNISLKAVHIHHGLRGKEADNDAAFVKKLCKNMDIEFSLYKFDIKQEAYKYKLTEEEAGRKIRYDVFNKEVKAFNNGKIAVAHHMNDNVETILFNLIRGTGLKGLGGIRPVRDNIIRPLINSTRFEIEEYCTKNCLKYVVDSTNEIDIYSRNQIRLRLIPYVEEKLNPQFVKNLSQSADIFRLEEDYIEIEAQKAYKQCTTIKQQRTIIYIDIFNTIHEAIQNRVLRIILNYHLKSLKDIGMNHIDTIKELIKGQTGKKIHLPNNIIVEKSYDEVYVYCKSLNQNVNNKTCYSINTIPITIDLEKYNKKLQVFFVEYIKKNSYPKNHYTKWFDYDRIVNTLKIRNRLPGDFFIINGGRKKIKDYFIDNKIPREDREKILLLADGSHILWIYGYRISDYYKITNKTNRILEVTIN